MKEKLKCWEFFACNEKECPVFKSKEVNCWLTPGTHCREQIQGRFLEKMEMCLGCEPLKANTDVESIGATLRVVNEQFTQFRRMVEERDTELEGISMELALGLSEVFEALKEISSGDPSARLPEISGLELITKLKHMVNLTAEELTEIVNLSHEFAIGLAEHFDTLHRVSKGELTARISGASQVELLESLKKVTNQMIDSVSGEIAERKRVEQELRQSEKRYRGLFDTFPYAIFILDRETLKILDANARAESDYGYSKEELLKMSLPSLGHEEDVQEIMGGFKSVSGDRSVLFSKKQHRRKDGSLFFTNIHVSGAWYMGRNALIATTTDISESLVKEAQLIQASKLATLGEMAAAIAHELNQPLNVMKVGTDLLRKIPNTSKKLDDGELSTVTQLVSSQVDKASTIINHLREFARSEDLKTEKVDINKPIRDVFKILGQQLKLRQIEIELDLDEHLPPIRANSNRLEQVFVNLVTNARDAMDDKTPSSTKLIRIKSFIDNGNIVVTVSDTGDGIPKKAIDRIFEPFFTTKQVGKGTGLGLSISYGIVKDYRGAIKVESKVGIGTTFELRFPCVLKGHRGDY